MNFQYKGRDSSGRIVTGFLEANNRAMLVKALHERGLEPLAVMPAVSEKGKASSPTSVLTSPPIFKTGQLRAWLRLTPPIQEEEVLIFTRDLLSLVHSGIPLVAGLRDIVAQIKNRHMKRILEHAVEDVNSGSRLSEALAKYPQVFGEFYTESIRAGEESGRLESVLERLSRNLERDLATKVAIKNAVRYPIIVLCFLGLAFVVMITFVIPRISAVYAHYGSKLPLPTRMLIAFSNFCQDYGMVLILVAVVGVFLIRSFIRTPGGGFLWDSLKLRMPVFGDLFRKVALARFASTLQTLYASGIVLPTALEISSRASGNRVIGRAVYQASQEIRSGKPLSELFAGNRLFPPLVVRMVTVGERTGNLEGMLGEVVSHYERDIEYLTKSLTTLVEPLLIFCLGIIILIFALGVFLPMWNLVRIVKSGG